MHHIGSASGGHLSPIVVLVGAVIGVSILSYSMLLAPEMNNVKTPISKMQDAESKKLNKNKEETKPTFVDLQDGEFNCVRCKQECDFQKTCPQCTIENQLFNK